MSKIDVKAIETEAIDSLAMTVPMEIPPVFLKTQAEESKVKKIVSITHAHCVDGIMSSYLIEKIATTLGLRHKAFFSNAGEPVFAGDVLDFLQEETKDTIIVVADLMPQDSEDWGTMIEFCEKDGWEGVVIDHHKSAIETFRKLRKLIKRSNVNVWFDRNQSAAAMVAALHDKVYGLVNDKGKIEQLTPENSMLYTLSAYAQDRDIWTHSLPWTEEINSHLANCKKGNLYDPIDDLVSSKISFETIIQEAAPKLAFKKEIVEHIAESSFYVYNGGIQAAMIIGPYALSSDVCEKMIQIHKGIKTSILIAPTKESNVWNLSARGRQALEFASLYGGGGHQNAAGAKITDADLWSLMSTRTDKIISRLQPLEEEEE